MSQKHALQIFRAALNAADPTAAVLRHVKVAGGSLNVDGRKYRLSNYDRIRVVGAGKASARMAHGLERLLGNRIADGWVNVPDGTALKLRRVHLQDCGHPVPDLRGVAGARRIAELARESGPRDLLLCVISGGASALMPLPAPGVTG